MPDDDGTAFAELVRFYDGERLAEKASIAAYVMTAGEDGWPHAAMISVGELLVGADRSAKVALWTHSRTTQNLIRTGQAVILVVLSRHPIRARLRLRPSEAPRCADGLRMFTGAVESAAADVAPYAELVSAVTFRLHQVEDSVARWARTLECLRSL
jgi:hypothetical protein